MLLCFSLPQNKLLVPVSVISATLFDEADSKDINVLTRKPTNYFYTDHLAHSNI